MFLLLHICLSSFLVFGWMVSVLVLRQKRGQSQSISKVREEEGEGSLFREASGGFGFMACQGRRGKLINLHFSQREEE